jgi:DNA-binding transcriptional MerR regulator
MGETDKIIQENYSNLLSIKEIAKKSSVSIATVRLWIRKNKIRRRVSMQQELMNKIKKLHKDGLSNKQIKNITGYSINTIKKYIRINKIKAKNPGIYCLTCLIDGRKYIGKSLDLNIRKKEFENFCRHNSKAKAYAGAFINEALKKYGIHNFQRTILTHCKEEELEKMEQFYIDRLNTEDERYGFNIQVKREKKQAKTLLRLQFDKRYTETIENFENYAYNAIFEKMKNDGIIKS